MEPSNKLIKACLQSPYWNIFQTFIRHKPSPFLVINLKQVTDNYQFIQKHLPPKIKIYYPVKANPHPILLQHMQGLGACFEVASTYELDLVLKTKNPSIPPLQEQISYGNPIKKEADIADAYKKGIRYFVCDCHEEMIKLARRAPKSKLIFRLATPNQGALLPLTKKFGVADKELDQLIMAAKKKDLIPYGLSFHVGSQQQDMRSWQKAIHTSHGVFERLKQQDIPLDLLNLGGGLPIEYLDNPSIQPLDAYLTAITDCLHKTFKDAMPKHVWIEPGRAMVGTAGIIVSEVILKTRRNNHQAWLYLDVGVFSGFMEAFEEIIKYPAWTEKSEPLIPYILAGPTCDEMDVLYQTFRYPLPKNITLQDKVYFFATGAYTHSYSAINFNGYPPLKSYCL